MGLSNQYNFRNPIRHFINIDYLMYPSDISTFEPIDELCWTKPISFRIYKADDRFRTIKMPNILNYVRALNYYRGLPYFDDIKNLDIVHKRLDVNMDTGDFVSGNYDLQLNCDFINLCNYDVLVKLDISEYYGRIYTHYLDLEENGLADNPLAWLNNGRTSGLLMGNYLSLYFAEYLSSCISEKLQEYMEAEHINCDFNYFSDDFYFFCDQENVDNVIRIFDKTLALFDFVRKEKKEVWTYETYNTYNLLTRYWKATIKNWNLEILKDCENHRRHPEISIEHKLSFLNQLVYRLSMIQDEKNKRSFIINFFKTRHFQSVNYANYKVSSYDLHQLFFLIKCAPESLLYISHIICEIRDIRYDSNTRKFLKARYETALKRVLHDEQLYFYYAIKVLGFDDILVELKNLVLPSQNQVLISYYLKDNMFSEEEILSLEEEDGEEYWFQSYHLILYTSLRNDLNTSIKKYLIPERLTFKPNSTKENRYMSFYNDNLQNGNSLICDIPNVTDRIKDYLELRFEETARNFDE